MAPTSFMSPLPPTFFLFFWVILQSACPSPPVLRHSSNHLRHPPSHLSVILPYLPAYPMFYSYSSQFPFLSSLPVPFRSISHPSAPYISSYATYSFPCALQATSLGSPATLDLLPWSSPVQLCFRKFHGITLPFVPLLVGESFDLNRKQENNT